jgi:UDP-hydrolysing UDP-N-acetyl-D-glucosamine 2-epimerase
MKIVDELQKLKPDMVLINADRFEMMGVAIAAAYLNIPIVHNEAGDVSGTIDESVRHAITKFAQVQFTSTETSRARVLQMGENPKFVFAVGSPAIDAAARVDRMAESKISSIDLTKPYCAVLVHPVTTESREENEQTLEAVTAALEKLAMPAIIIGANSDAGSNTVGKGVVAWYEKTKPAHIYFAKHLHPERFYRILARAAVALGNSSSFIREGAFFGTPVVLVGSRQQKRERGANVIEVESEPAAIIQAVRKQLAHGRYQSDARFGDGNASERMADILATVNPPIQKQFFEI